MPFFESLLLSVVCKQNKYIELQTTLYDQNWTKCCNDDIIMDIKIGNIIVSICESDSPLSDFKL